METLRFGLSGGRAVSDSIRCLRWIVDEEMWDAWAGIADEVAMNQSSADGNGLIKEFRVCYHATLCYIMLCR